MSPVVALLRRPGYVRFFLLFEGEQTSVGLSLMRIRP